MAPKLCHTGMNLNGYGWGRKEYVLVDGKFGLGLYGTGRAPAMGGLQGHLSFKLMLPSFTAQSPRFEMFHKYLMWISSNF